ncbi:N-acetyltransferase, partial [Mesorhizobium sp. M7D.F.Ca.US.004.01.2.1]
QDTVFGYAARETGQGAKPPVGFVLARLAAGEGEILTVAVARSHRRQGLGWQLMDAVLRELHAQRAEALFLEVDETNVAAIALYRRLGFREVGKRPNYYRSAEHGPTGALVMRRDLR